MKTETPGDRDANARLLRSARANYESLRVALEATVERLQVDGDIGVLAPGSTASLGGDAQAVGLA